MATQELSENEQRERTQKQIESIDRRRERVIEGGQLDPKAVDHVENSSNEVYRLKAEIQHLYDQVKDFLPTHKQEEINGVLQETPATWNDIKAWIANDELKAHFLKAEEVKAEQRRDKEQKDSQPIEPAVKPRLLEKRALNKVKKIKRALDLQEAADKLTGGSEKGSDEQKMTKLFSYFRLRELAESRIVRRETVGNLQELEEDITDAIADGDRWEDVEDFEEEKKLLHQRLKDEVMASPESYYDYWGQELLKAQAVFTEQGKIYETPSVKTKINKLRALIERGGAAFIHGETGTGKTELARYIATQYLQKEPLVISGRKTLEFSEIVESQDIHVEKQKLPIDQRLEVSERVQKDLQNPELVKIMQSQAVAEGKKLEDVMLSEREKLEAGYIEYYKNPIEVGSRLQSYYQAAKEGRMVIIDEMNAIPHHTLIALNDLLTKRPLEQNEYYKYQVGLKPLSEVPENNIVRPIYGAEPIVIAPGFCVVATGNWKPEDGANYVGRQTLDSAFMRRFGVVEYDYLPNPVEGTLESNDPQEERILKEQAELYRMLCARVINKDLTGTLPEDIFSQLEELAKVARVIQDGFSGKKVSEEYMPESLSGNGGRLKPEDVIKENVLDIGKLTQYVIGPWKQDGFRYPLEVYLFDRFITRSSARPTEMIFLYNAFQLRGFFDPGQGWPSLVDLRATVAPSEQPDPDADPNQQPPAPPAAPNAAAHMEQLKGERVREVLNFGNRLEKVIYNKHTIKYSEEQLSNIEKPTLRFFSPIEIVDKVVGRPPERLRFPDLSRSIAQEGEVSQGVEANVEELAEIQQIRDWKDSVESTVIGLNENAASRAEIHNLAHGGTVEPEINQLLVTLNEELAALNQLIETNGSVEEMKDKQKNIEHLIKAEREGNTTDL